MAVRRRARDFAEIFRDATRIEYSVRNAVLRLSGNGRKRPAPPWFSLLFLRAHSSVYTENANADRSAKCTSRSHRSVVATGTALIFSTKYLHPSPAVRIPPRIPDNIGTVVIPLGPTTDRSVGHVHEARSCVRFMRAHGTLGKDKWIIGL